MSKSLADFEISRYIERSPKSKEFFDQAQKYLPDGVTRGTSYEPYPLFWEKGEGFNIWDLDGIKRLDFFGNNSSLPLGHGNIQVQEAINKQLQEGVSFNAPHPTHVELAKIICERIKSVDSVRFTNSGTEATMNCIYASRAYTGRSYIAKVDGAYHGMYDSVAFNSVGESYFPDKKMELPNMPAELKDTVKIIPYNNSEKSIQIIKANADKLACVVVEPMLGGSGFIQADLEYLQNLRQVTKEEGIVLVFDEVCSLRAGYGGAQSYYDVYPDMSAFGKSLGGGLPIGAFGGKHEIMALYQLGTSGQHVQHSGSFNGNPISMVSGLSTFKQLTPDVYKKLDFLTRKLKEGIKNVASEFEIPVQITGLGSLFALHFNSHSIKCNSDTDSNDKNRLRQVFFGLLNEGIWPSQNLLGAVSTPMKESEIDEYLIALRNVFARNR